RDGSPARHEHASPARAASAPAATCIRDAPAGGRGRPADDPGAARSQLALDDADLFARRRAAAAQGLRQLAPAVVMDSAVESFLALSAVRLAPRTIEAYRRDLAHFEAWLGGSPAAATPDQLASYVAQLRADGRAATTIARRVAALRSFFRHEV